MRKKPMLAYPVSDKPINYDDKVFMQPKLDGVRCVIQANVKRHILHPSLNDVSVVAYSRTGKEWKNIHHILKQLKPFFQKYPNVILDGELYNHDLRDDFETIISLVRRQKPDDIDMLESADLVQFHCYDIIAEHFAFEDRNLFIEDEITCHVPLLKSVRGVKTREVFNDDDAKAWHKKFLQQGYEGSILRTNDTYACKRSHNLRKFKDFHDDEAMILDWVEGKGKRKGTIGKFMAQDSAGNIFGMPVMDKFKFLQDNFKKMQGYVGKTATFTYFERTKANSYRHPLFKCIRNYE